MPVVLVLVNHSFFSPCISVSWGVFLPAQLRFLYPAVRRHLNIFCKIYEQEGKPSPRNCALTFEVKLPSLFYIKTEVFADEKWPDFRLKHMAVLLFINMRPIKKLRFSSQYFKPKRARGNSSCLHDTGSQLEHYQWGLKKLLVIIYC